MGEERCASSRTCVGARQGADDKVDGQGTWHGPELHGYSEQGVRASADNVAPRFLSLTLYLICCYHCCVLVFPFLCSYLFFFSLSRNRWESIIVSHEILRELIAGKSMLRAFDD